MSNTSASASTSTSTSTPFKDVLLQELKRLHLLKNGINDDEFKDILVYITKNYDEVPYLVKSLNYGNDNVKLMYLRNILALGMFLHNRSIMLLHVIFANNIKYSILCSYFSSLNSHKKHSRYRRKPCCQR